MNSAIMEQIIQQGGIESYLQQQQHKGLLRLITCGNVDDGKSTLIGRLLHDTRQIYDDQLSSLHSESKRFGNAGNKIDLALLVDGLQAEREQGITIDVAYRYFSTTKRKFIIADAPGHEQYTRNMATGASTSQAAVLLVDARKGIQTQTRRHSFIITLLGINDLIVAVNKMDLVNYNQTTFNTIQEEYLQFIGQLAVIPRVHFVPISALEGDNVVTLSHHMPWYGGSTLLDLLEILEVKESNQESQVRFPVQYVNRPHLDFRGYAGTLSAGKLAVGQTIKVLPSGVSSTIKQIITFDGDKQEVYPGEAITVVLKDDLDIIRGDIIVDKHDPITTTRNAIVDVVWMAETPLQPGQRYDIKIASKYTQVQIRAIDYQVDINTLVKNQTDHLPLNGIGLVKVVFDEPLALDYYWDNQQTGSFIFIDRLTNITVGAGLVREHRERTYNLEYEEYSPFELELNALIRRHFPHWNARDLLKG